MANELVVNVSGKLTNGALSEAFAPGSLQVTQDVMGSHAPMLIVGFGAEEDVPTGDITTVGWLFMRNLDTTNFVTYGPKFGGVMVPFGRLEPLESHAIRLEPGTTVRWQADTADVKVKILLLDD